MNIGNAVLVELEEIRKLRNQAHWNGHLPWLRRMSLFCARRRLRVLRVALGAKEGGSRTAYPRITSTERR